MILVMNPQSTSEQVSYVVDLLGTMKLDSCVIEGASQKFVEVLGVDGRLDRDQLENAPMVERLLERAVPILGAKDSPADATIEVPLGAAATVGGNKLAVIAGPCSVESKRQLMDIAAEAKEAGAVALRGGAFKPRTSPYCFQGHGEAGLEFLAMAGEEHGLAIVTEVMCCEQVELVSRYADVLQIGSRNMHNTHLLKAVGKQSKPVLLKRGWSATFEEFMLAAEYVMLGGNPNVILCERGIRTHETYVRNTLPLAIVPEIKRTSKLPIIVDPSHGTGRDYLVAPMSNAAIACGADGLLVEVHDTPSQAWTDGSQSLDPQQFRDLMEGLVPFAQACKREL